MGRAAAALDITMGEALEARPQLSALACVDTRTDHVLGSSFRHQGLEERLQLAAQCAAHLCSIPELDDPFEEIRRSDEALVISSGWLEAYARVPKMPDLVVIGLIHESANVALLLAWVKQVAASVASGWNPS